MPAASVYTHYSIPSPPYKMIKYQIEHNSVGRSYIPSGEIFASYRTPNQKNDYEWNETTECPK